MRISDWSSDVCSSDLGLMEGTLDVLLDLLSQGDLDIVISRSTVERIDEANIQTEVLYVEPVNLVVRPDHPLLGLSTIGWPDLQSYRWVVWPRCTSIRNTLEAALKSVGQALPQNFKIGRASCRERGFPYV